MRKQHHPRMTHDFNCWERWILYTWHYVFLITEQDSCLAMWQSRLDPLGLLLLAQPHGMSCVLPSQFFCNKRPYKSTNLQKNFSTHQHKNSKDFPHTTYVPHCHHAMHMMHQRAMLSNGCQGQPWTQHKIHRDVPQGWWAIFALTKQLNDNVVLNRPKQFNRPAQLVGPESPFAIGWTRPKSPLTIGWNGPKSPLAIGWKE